MKAFLSAGDILINPDRIAYAVIETDTDGQKVRLGFAGGSSRELTEVRLEGFEARSLIRWLRQNAEYLDSGVSTVHRDASHSSTHHSPQPMSVPFAVRRPTLRKAQVCAEA